MAKDKILLASGCSYTDPNFYSEDETLPEEERGGWAKWPALVSDHLNLKCVNLGSSGCDNGYILDSIIDGIVEHGKLVDTIMVLWTGGDRFKFYGHNVGLGFPAIGTGINYLNDYLNNPRINKQPIWHKCVEDTLRRQHTLYTLCNKLGIKLIMAQGLYPLNPKSIDKQIKLKNLEEHNKVDKDELFKSIITSKYFYSLEEHKKHIIGWPYYKKLNGHTLNNIRFEKEGMTVPWDEYVLEPGGVLKYCVSSADLHPNGPGQEIFAKEFINAYERVYNTP